MDVIAIANLKGGVGKTTTSHVLGTLLARDHRQNVLLVDCDPQASLTRATGIDNANGRNLAEVLGGVKQGKLKLVDVLQATTTHFTSLIMICPSDMSLIETEMGLVRRRGKEYVLKEALESVRHIFDVAILDCPPSLNLLTVNALTASDGLICPTIPQYADLRGFRLFLNSVTGIRKRFNPKLAFLGVLITFYDSRLNLHNRTIREMQSSGLQLFDTRIGRTVRIAEAYEGGQPFIDYAPNNIQAAAYQNFAAEVTTWLRKQRS